MVFEFIGNNIDNNIDSICTDYYKYKDGFLK